MSASRIGRPDLMVAVAQAQAQAGPASTRPYLGLGAPRPDPVRRALAPRSPSPDLTAVKPSQRLAALALAAQQLAAGLEPVPLALDAIAKRVRARITPAQRPGDDALVEDLHQLRDRAFALSLDVYRLERASRAP